MSTPEYIVNLRKHIGHQQLFLPSCTMIILRPAPAGASIWEVPKALLARRADNGNWAPVTGICEPGEEVAITAVREVKEEVGVDAKVEALLGVGLWDLRLLIMAMSACSWILPCAFRFLMMP